MIKAPVLLAINKQIQHEQSNAHTYHAVSLYFGRLNLKGLKSFMARQAREERQHAGKLIRHVADRGGQVDLGAIPAPRGSFATPLEAAKSVRDLEHGTTEMIHRLCDLARKEADISLEVLLHWFVTEQVEEEQWSGELVSLMEQFHERPGQLYMLDRLWGRKASVR
jgi:ferritin